MQAVILSAGRGERFGEITQSTPKPLLEVQGQPMIKRILDSVPEGIEEVIIVVDRLGNKIKDYMEGLSWGFSFLFVQQGQLRGTAGALWSAKDLLEDYFLVLNTDDLVDKSELQQFTSQKLLFGVKKRELPDAKYFTVILDEDQKVLDLRRPQNEEERQKALIATGVYSLDRRIFSYSPVPLPNKDNEFGLPQTIIKMAKDCSVQAVFMEKWFPINTPADLDKAQKLVGR